MQELLPIPRISPTMKPAESFGMAGEMKWIPLKKLRIDTNYQRPVGERGTTNIRQIIGKFSWSCFSPLVVSERKGGVYAVIDGQHRAIAAASHGGIEMVPCIVITADEDQEALAFTTINGSVTAVMAQHLYYARLTAREPKAVALSKALAAAGATVLRVPKVAMAVGDCNAISTLERCLRHYGAETLIPALQTVTETDDGNPGLLKAPIISATCGVLGRNPLWRDAGERLFKAVERVGVKALYKEALISKASRGGAARLHYAKGLIDTLNQHLGDGK